MADPTTPAHQSVLRHLDTAALRRATRKETRARQHHLPPVSVYRWWARRTASVSGAIIDAVNTDHPGRLVLADPFAGGGVIALSALVRGHQVYAQDINPWAARSLATMIGLSPAADLEAAGTRLHALVADTLATAYGTKLTDGTPATLAHTIRVATAPCPGCKTTLRLFPTGLVSRLERVETGGDDAYVACRAGHLNLASASKRSTCGTCRRYIKPSARYTANRSFDCAHCGTRGKVAELATNPGLTWEPVLVQRVTEARREIAPPTPREIRLAATDRWSPARSLPKIASGIETAVLVRHGMTRWHDLYPSRQRQVLESILDACAGAAKGNVGLRRELEAAVIGSAEFAGLASRWDPAYLKPYETTANHRFNFTTLSAEPCVWGSDADRGIVGRRLQQMVKASLWLAENVGHAIHVDGPTTSAERRSAIGHRIDARVVTGSSSRLNVPRGALDACVTDPPYHDDVQYAELSDIFRAWSGDVTGQLVGDAVVTSRATDGTAAYQSLLTDVFEEIARALRPGGHLVMSYANRHPGAWVALFNALEATGFRAVGYSVVHSENETDYAKTGRRACNLDVLIDLIVDDGAPIEQFEPHPGRSQEQRFCAVVGGWALKVGSLEDGWAERFTAEVRGTAFLARPKKR